MNPGENIKLNPSPVPRLSAPQTRFGRLFVGDRGLRAGWRLLLYFFGVGILLWMSLLTLHTFFGGPGVDTPMRAITTEILQILSAVIPALIATRLENRPWGSYGLPFCRPATGYLITGLVIGFAALSALLLLIHLFHGYYMGPMQLHGAQLIHYAFLWGIAFR